MALIIYWGVKILLWAALILSLYSIVKPHLMLNLLIRTFEIKMAWFGLKGHVEAGPNAHKVTQIWSIVWALVLAGLVYIFSQTITIGYVLK